MSEDGTCHGAVSSLARCTQYGPGIPSHLPPSLRSRGGLALVGLPASSARPCGALGKSSGSEPQVPHPTMAHFMGLLR